MTEQFASIELARLYESQGYLDDALAMYRTLTHEGGDAAMVSEAEEAVTRLEEQLSESRGTPPDTAPLPEMEGMDIQEGRKEPESEQEKRMAALLEKWLMLMVVQKRVNVFKAIRARL
ncbi:MAG: hypothetical protein HUN04_03650 [Desulfobacter sp.]|nr:MAG: hypothetical protein HUN04_03650 [Desulfobacter sp.]